MVRFVRLLPIFILLFTGCATGVRAQPAQLRGLDRYIEHAMAEWRVPGLAIAVVQGDSIVFSRGYGVRRLGERDPVDENTLFAIASTTKAMTAAALGILVDEGRLDWDDPVTRHLPGFEVSDPWVNRAFTIRDLLTHRSGLGRHDLIWIAAPFDRTEILRRARHLPSSGRFRADYGYHNVMYIAAGEVVSAVSGRSWDDFVADRIFSPLEMHRSTTRSAVVDTRDNVATAHTVVDGQVTPLQRRDYDNIGGAGAAWSSVTDMARWVRMHLADGSYRGTPILTPSTLREMHTPQTIIRSDTVAERLFPETNFRAYGLGWSLQDYRGRKLVHHSGSINWTRTQVGMLPAEGLGVVIITNLSSSNLQHALMYRVLDAMTGAEPRDWSAEYLALARRAEARSAEQRTAMEADRVQGTTPALGLDDFAGTYENDLFGEMRLQMTDGRLVLHYSPDYIADLEHWHHDTFRAVWRRTGFGSAFVTFVLDPRARVTAMEVEDFGRFEPVSGGPD
jgi:CubicO group peptidase (beta-lactamase class C family)